jgi:hypothetical protein
MVRLTGITILLRSCFSDARQFHDSIQIPEP